MLEWIRNKTKYFLHIFFNVYTSYYKKSDLSNTCIYTLYTNITNMLSFVLHNVSIIIFIIVHHFLKLTDLISKACLLLIISKIENEITICYNLTQQFCSAISLRTILIKVSYDLKEPRQLSQYGD
jgi:hypothetical protein